jgi:hypothetical protein
MGERVRYRASPTRGVVYRKPRSPSVPPQRPPSAKAMRGDRIAICRRPGNRMSPLSRAIGPGPLAAFGYKLLRSAGRDRLAARAFNASMLPAILPKRTECPRQSRPPSRR